MSFIDLEFEVESNVKYWKGDEVGEFLEGNICKEITDGYGNRQLVVDRGEDEYGNPIYTALPTNASIRRYYKNLMIGDYVRVEFVDIKEPYSEGMYPQKIFRVQKNPDKFKEYPNNFRCEL